MQTSVLYRLEAMPELCGLPPSPKYLPLVKVDQFPSRSLDRRSGVPLGKLGHAIAQFFCLSFPTA